VISVSVLFELLISFLVEVVTPFLFELFFYLMMEIGGYYIARAALPWLSSGRIILHPLGFGDRQGFNWLGYRRDSIGRLEVEPGAAGFLGFHLRKSARRLVLIAHRRPEGAPKSESTS
jgi:hypothetical protein